MALVLRASISFVQASLKLELFIFYLLTFPSESLGRWQSFVQFQLLSGSLHPDLYASWEFAGVLENSLMIISECYHQSPFVTYLFIVFY